MRTLITLITISVATAAIAKEYQVGADFPLKTISAAAELAQPGDTVIVHAGVYRERVNPPRGGTSDQQRITYQAAPGNKVIITGSEPMKGWEKVANDTWKVVIPNKFFGSFNPYADRIRGDWFNARGRQHHTGAVYLNGHWLIEAASHLNEVLAPAGKTPLWFARVDNAENGDYLLNFAGITVGQKRIAADTFAGKSGELRPAACSEGGQCIGWILPGNWLKFDKVDFGAGTESIAVRAASVTGGGSIEIRADSADGELLGTVAVADTGDWQKWQTFTAKIKPTSGQKSICMVFRSSKSATDNTTIWAQFPGVNPNEANVEINVRKTVFTPEKTGVNFITVRGFTLRNAATNWAPPSAGQIGLVSAYWCKGWIIENNDIAYSKCSGIALGKYSDEFDNTNKAGAADPYTECVRRALKNGWNKETVGSHIVRNNRISHCEQTGIVGSMGAAFSTITGNEIHDIHVHRLFTGAEMGGIKFHAAVDTEISGNHIYRVGGVAGIWLDWMTQGTRVTGNLMHDNTGLGDIFLEVNHGPFLVANNILLSGQAIDTQSNGGAFAHNLMIGKFRVRPEPGRDTPVLEPHGTQIVALKKTEVGDDRWFNNLLAGSVNLGGYDGAKLPVFMTGNVFTKAAQPSKHEADLLRKPDFDTGVQLEQRADGWYLTLAAETTWRDEQRRKLVTTELLGKATLPAQSFVKPDGTPLTIAADYLGKKRYAENPFPGPFEITQSGKQEFKVWPKE